MLKKKVMNALVCAMGFVSFFSFACAVCVLMLCFGDSQGHFQPRHAGLDASEKGLLVIAYGLASLGMTLWIVLGRMHQAAPKAGLEE